MKGVRAESGQDQGEVIKAEGAHADPSAVEVGRERSILRTLNINTETYSLPFRLHTSPPVVQIRLDGRTDTSVLKLGVMLIKDEIDFRTRKITNRDKRIYFGLPWWRSG